MSDRRKRSPKETSYRSSLGEGRLGEETALRLVISVWPVVEEGVLSELYEAYEELTAKAELPFKFELVGTDGRVVAFRLRGVPWYKSIPDTRITSFITTLERHHQDAFLSQIFGKEYHQFTGKSLVPIPRCDKCGKEVQEETDAHIVSSTKVVCNRCFENMRSFFRAITSVLPADAHTYSAYDKEAMP